MCQQVELLHEQGLVLGPREVECLRGHKLRDTIGLVEVVMLQLRDAMEATGLKAEGGGRCLESNAVSGRGTRRGSAKKEREERDCTGASEAARRALGRTSRLNMMGGKLGRQSQLAQLEEFRSRRRSRSGLARLPQHTNHSAPFYFVYAPTSSALVAPVDLLLQPARCFSART